MIPTFRLRRITSGLVLHALGAIAAVAAAPSAGAGVRLLESDERHAIVEILPADAASEPMEAPGRSWIRLDIPGLGRAEEVGRPEIPSGGFRLALPPGTVPRLRVVSAEWSQDQLGALVPVPARRGVREPFGTDVVVEDLPVEGPEYHRSPTYPAEAFRIAAVKGLRDLRVAEVWYAGARALVSSGRHQLLRRAVLEVTFVPDGGRAARVASRPALRPELWDRTASSGVLNAELARAWARGGPGDAPSVGNAPWGAGDQWRVEVNATGLARLSYATLAAAGFPSGVAIGQVGLYQRTFDLASVDNPAVAAADLFVVHPVPAIARDANGNGIFDAGDSLLFWGRSLRDQWMTSGWENEDLFDTRNFVWVRIDPAGGARMTSRPGAVPTATDVLTATPYTVHRENDAQYTQYPADFGPGREAFEAEFYYWNGHTTITLPTEPWRADDNFTAQDPVPGGAATLVGRVCPTGRGQATNNDNYTNVVTFGINGTEVGQRQFWNRNLYSGTSVVPPANVLNTYAVPAGVLVDGTNSFRFTGVTYAGNGTTTVFANARFLFDWYEVTYPRQLIARGGQLLLSTSSGPSAPVSVTVTGFDGSDLLLLDVTDGAAPEQVQLVPGQITGSGTFALQFEHDNAAGPGRYLAAREASARAVADAEVARVAQPTLLAGGTGAKWLAVAADELMAGAQELATFRSSRYSALAAPVSQVWDVFHNGTRDPVALKAYAAYAYHRWSDPLVFLCLIGDASEDHRGVGPDALPDMLPSHSLWTDYEGVPEETDQFYAEVTSDGAGTFDDLSDLYVGRLSVSTPDELAWNVQRIRAYETQDADGLWRRRVLLLSDDALSGDLGNGTGHGYGWNAGEREFCRKSHVYADSLAAHPADRILPDVLCVSDFTHPCPDSCNAPNSPPTAYPYDCEQMFGLDCGLWYDCRIRPAEWAREYPCMVDSVASAVVPVLRQKLDAGVMVWNYQGHANKFQLAHEYIFRDDALGERSRRDVSALTNEGKPFIFLGFACHLAEFDRASERSSEDCLAEKLMNQRGAGQTVPAGSVGSFCSSGYEFLYENLSFNQYVMDAFFFPEKAEPGAALPDDGSSGYAWTLGESTTRARLMYQDQYTGAGTSRQAAQRFVLMGDPALSPDLGSPRLEVRVNGRPVQNAADPYFATPDDAGNSLLVEFTATDGRGITATRIRDTARGVVPETEYERTVNLATPDGVPQSVTLTDTVELRAGEVYDVRFEADDSSGKTSVFVLSTDTRFRFLDKPVIFPNPFRDRTQVAFKVTGAVRGGTLDIYAISGRKIRSIPVGTLASNEQHAVEWDGRDDHGLDVAGGTYLGRLRVESGAGSASETVPIVRIR